MTREQCGGDGIIVRDGMPISAPDIEDVIGYEALWESARKCELGVKWKGSVASFHLNASEQVGKLCRELHDGTYKPRKTTTFEVTSPKRRTITSTPFRDRVYQRSLNDNVLYPCVTRSLIYDNAACQSGKGTDFARARLKCHLQRHWRKHGLDGWVLKIDVAGYYPNMPHATGEAVFDKVPDWARRMALDVLRGQYAGSTGYNPGSQMVQLVGIAALNGIDHMVKERHRIKGYIRYMDDMLLIHEDKAHLLGCLEDISGRLSGMGLAVNVRKTRISKVSEPVRFLGFSFRLTGTGKVVMTLDPANVARMRRRIRRLHALESSGAKPPGTCDEAYAGWRAHAEKGDTGKLLVRCDRWYQTLWKEGTADDRNQETG